MQALGVVLEEFDLPGGNCKEVGLQIAEPAHLDCRLLLDYWHRCTQSGGMMIGRDVPSRNLARILSNLLVYEPLEDHKDFRIRLAGASVWRRFGRDITGTLFSDHFTPEVFERRRTNMVQTIAQQKPFLRDVKMMRDNRPELHFEVLNLPALAPHSATHWVLGGIFYFG